MMETWREAQDRRLGRNTWNKLLVFVYRMLIGLIVICLIWGEWNF